MFPVQLFMARGINDSRRVYTDGIKTCARIGARHCVVAEPIVGTALELKLMWWVSAIRLGANYWVPVHTDSLGGRRAGVLDRGSPDVGIYFFGSKLRVDIARSPEVMAWRQRPVIAQIGLGDLNGLLFWGKRIF